MVNTRHGEITLLSKVNIFQAYKTWRRKSQSKQSIGGVKARRFLGFHGQQGKFNSRTGGSSIKWNQWKALHNAIKDHGDEGQTRNRKAEVWEALDKVLLYCEKTKWTGFELEDYKQTLKIFKRKMSEAWSVRHGQTITLHTIW